MRTTDRLYPREPKPHISKGHTLFPGFWKCATRNCSQYATNIREAYAKWDSAGGRTR